MASRFKQDSQEEGFQEMNDSQITDASSVQPANQLKSSNKQSYPADTIITVEQFRQMEIKVSQAQKEKQQLLNTIKEVRQSSLQNFKKLMQQNDQWKKQCSEAVNERQQLRTTVNQLENQLNKANENQSSIHLSVSDSWLQPADLKNTLSEEIMFGKQCPNCKEKIIKINRLQLQVNQNKMVIQDMVHVKVKIHLEERNSILQKQLQASLQREKDLEAEVQFLRGPTTKLSVKEDGTIIDDKYPPTIRFTTSDYISIQPNQHKICQSYPINQNDLQITELQTKILQLTEKIHEYQQKLEKFQQNIQELQQKMLQKQREIYNLAKVGESVQQQMLALKDTIRRNNKCIMQLTVEVDELRTENGNNVIIDNEQTKQIEMLQVIIKSLKQQIILHNMQTTSMLKEKSSLEAETKKNITEIEEKYKQIIATLKEQNSVLTQKIQSINQQLQNQKATNVNQLTNQMRDQHQASQTNQQTQQLKRELDNLRVAHQRLKLELLNQNIFWNQQKGQLNSIQHKLMTENQILYKKSQSMAERILQLEANNQKLQINNDSVFALQSQISLLHKRIVALERSQCQKSSQISLLTQKEISTQRKINDLQLSESLLREQLQKGKSKSTQDAQIIRNMQITINTIRSKVQQAQHLQRQLQKVKNPRTINEKFQVVKGWFELKQNQRKYEYQPRPVSRIRANIELMNWIEEYFRVIVAESLETYEGDMI